MDDVTALLASPALQSNQVNQNQFKQLLLTAAISPNIFKNDLNRSNKIQRQEQQLMSPDMIAKKNQLRLSANISCLNEFEHQIKQLEQQAKNLKDDRETDMISTSSSNSAHEPISNQIFPNDENSNNFNFNGFNLNDMNNILARGYSNNLVDVRKEENYLKEIKEKLEQQLRETEILKQELIKNKEQMVQHQQHPPTNLPTLFQYQPEMQHQISNRPLPIQNVFKSSSSNTLSSTNSCHIDELIELRMKLNEANRVNEEQKNMFKQNLSQLEITLKECVDDKEKLMLKKDNKIKELGNELEITKARLTKELDETKKDLKEQQELLGQGQTYDNLKARLEIFNDFSNKLRKILLIEEKKKEKSYFLEDYQDLDEYTITNENNKVDSFTKRLLKGITKCLEDYQGEFKHSKLIIKELQNSWETKEKKLEQKETNLNEDFNKKCETIKQEYDRLLSNKMTELNKLQSQVDELNEEINKIKVKYRKEIDAKELELKTARLNHDNIKQEFETNLNELKQLKTRFDTLKNKDKENQIEFEKSLSNLETENEKLNAKYLDVSKELSDIQNKYEITKCQLAKYEQLIDSLNEQIILLKRDNKELQLNYLQANQSLESLQDIRNKLEVNCKDLENQLNEMKKINSEHQQCGNNMSNLEIKIQQLSQSLEAKNSECSKQNKQLDKNEIKLQNQIQQTMKLSEQKLNLETKLNQIQQDYNDMKIKFQNSTTLIQNTCKSNSLIKEEKESLEKILKDNINKIKCLKLEYDQLNEKYHTYENMNENLKADIVILEKKYNEIKNMNEITVKENDQNLKELNQVKTELNNSQISYKNLNRKLSQSLNEKDAQILQYQQSLALYEKEIDLLKQAETLHKNQEETKVLEVANTIQMKLTQKKNKIDVLRSRLSTLENNIDSLKKENAQINEEKFQIEQNLKDSQSKCESLLKELVKFETDFTELRNKMSNYEKALDKASINFTNSEKKNEQLKIELSKYKKLITKLLNTKEISLGQSIFNPISNSQNHGNTNNSNKKISNFLAQLLNSSEPVNKTISSPSSEEINLTNLLNDIKQTLISSSSSNNNIKTTNSSSDSTVTINEQNISITNTLIDESNQDENLDQVEETNKQLCNNIEIKLSKLNEIGLNLKKENNEVTQLLLKKEAAM